MARIIEFHMPAGFKRGIEWVPPQERGALIVFPPNLTKSESDASALDSEMTQQMNTQALELALVIWPLQELANVLRHHN